MTMRVGAAPGRVVKLPNRKKIPPNGLIVDETSGWWARLLRDGDVVEVDDKGKPVTAKPAVPPVAPPVAKEKAA